MVRCFPGSSDGKESACNIGDLGSVPWGWGDGPLKKRMATHCSILVWRVPQTEEPGWATYSPWGLKESDTIE